MKIPMALTSHDQFGDTGRKTGFWLEEFAAPYFVFRDAGVDLIRRHRCSRRRCSEVIRRPVIEGCAVKKHSSRSGGIVTLARSELRRRSWRD
jgi:hypothetical protein